jgi:hypothetical protein
VKQSKAAATEWEWSYPNALVFFYCSYAL